MSRSPRYDCIVDIINDCKPSTILEIGTHMGLTAAIMIEAAMKHKDDVFYYGFDLFDLLTEEMAMEEHHGKNMPSLSRVAKILAPFPHKLIMGNTRKTLPKFKPDRPIDFVFIDGGHSVETIPSDWENVEKLMHENTVVIFDDYYDDTEKVGCKTIVDSLDEKYSVEKISAPFSLASERRVLGKHDISLVKVALK